MCHTEQGKEEGEAAYWNMSFSEESLDKVPDSLVYTLKSFELVFLLGASCICLLWRSEKMEASEQTYSYTLTIFFFCLNICFCLRVSANITGSRSYFLDWCVAQYHIPRHCEEKEQLWRYQHPLHGACFHDFYILE